MWRLKNTFLNNQWIKEDMKKEIRQYFEKNENNDTIFQNLWDAVEVVLTEKFIVVNTYIKKEDLKLEPQYSMLDTRKRKSN